MGFPNLAQEEAKIMPKRSERSLVLFSMVFVFVCLLFSGGSRLIGGQIPEDPIEERPVSLVRAAFTGMPAPRAETGRISGDEAAPLRERAAPAPHSPILTNRVTSDANGNVLGAQTYLRAVYQAFVLDDGFV